MYMRLFLKNNFVIKNLVNNINIQYQCPKVKKKFVSKNYGSKVKKKYIKIYLR